jgi:uncharacterized peroxidase-related enzyme
MFLNAPADNPDNARLYQEDLDDWGFVMNLSRLWGWRPDVGAGFTGLRSQLTKGSALTERERAVTICATIGRLGDSYCALAWGSLLAKAIDPDTAAGVLRGVEVASLTPREIALSGWARQVAVGPNETTQAHVDQLRAAGFEDREIFEATALVAFRMAFSAVNAALGARPDRLLADGAPAAVRQAVNFGRPVDGTSAKHGVDLTF